MYKSVNQNVNKPFSSNAELFTQPNTMFLCNTVLWFEKAYQETLFIHF